MQHVDIRAAALLDFAERGHTVVPSAPLGATTDPPVHGGWNGSVRALTGLVPRRTRVPHERAEVHPHPDIEEVGKTPRHGTFFQMNGTGDYQGGSNQLCLGVVGRIGGRRRLDSPKRSLGDVYEEDDVSFDLWRRIAGLPGESYPASRQKREGLYYDGASRVRLVLTSEIFSTAGLAGLALMGSR
jgi:alanyl-tRNA synthetase